MKQIIKILPLLIPAFLVVLMIGLKNSEYETRDEQAGVLGTEAGQKQNMLEVVFPDGTVLSESLDYQANETAFQFLERIQAQRETFTFTYQQFDFGVFLTGINNQQADLQTEFWEFSVNGQPSATGISDYQLQSGDRISFKLVEF